MAGIIFYKTKMPEELDRFYIGRLGMELWLDQGGCRIYRSDNLLLGFCHREDADLDGIITFFFPERSQVDETYLNLKDIADAPPRHNSRYQIYQFFACDPEGRTLEFQSFEHPIDYQFA